MDEKENDRRVSQRRLNPTPLLNPFLFRGSRKTERREEERLKGYYVDNFFIADWLIFIGLVILNIVDLVFTLWHISEGGATEANPIMAFGLDKGGTLGFVLLKLALIIPSGLILLLHLRFPRTKIWFLILNAVYVGIFLFHLTPFIFYR